MNPKQRLRTYLDHKGIGVYKFARMSGLSVEYFRKGTSIRAGNLAKLAATFTDLNLVWLVTGTGEMLSGNGVGGVPGESASRQEVSVGRQASGKQQESHIQPERINYVVTTSGGRSAVLTMRITV